ncbi:hypothetical protein AAE478_002214 [Parahypoxylon ruwenzoriense]
MSVPSAPLIPWTGWNGWDGYPPMTIPDYAITEFYNWYLPVMPELSAPASVHMSQVAASQNALPSNTPTQPGSKRRRRGRSNRNSNKRDPKPDSEPPDSLVRNQAPNPVTNPSAHGQMFMVHPHLVYPRFVYPPLDDPRANDPHLVYPRFVYPPLDDPRANDPHLVYPRFVYPPLDDPRANDPHLVYPRFVYPPLGDPRANDPRFGGPPVIDLATARDLGWFPREAPLIDPGTAIDPGWFPQQAPSGDCSGTNHSAGPISKEEKLRLHMEEFEKARGFDDSDDEVFIPNIKDRKGKMKETKKVNWKE